MMKYSQNYLSLLLLLIASQLFAQKPTKPSQNQIERIDQYLKTEMEERQIPGMAYAICYGDEWIHSGAMGYADHQNEGLVKVNTRFMLASITKQFTASAIVLLQQDGKLQFDDPINKYLPETVPAWEEVKIHHLLTHTSGLPGQEGGNQYQNLKDIDKQEWLYISMMGHITKQNRFDGIKYDKLEPKPGEAFNYSNIGYFLLGMIIEQISGSYENFIQTRIFDVLGMKDSYILNPHIVRPLESRLYTRYNGAIVNNRMFWYNEVPASYGIYSTVEDLQKWGNALHSDVLFTPESKARMWSSTKLNDGTYYDYGYGWRVKKLDEKLIIRHSGITGTEMLKFVDEGVSIITLTNLGYNPVTINNLPDKPEFKVHSWGLVDGIAHILGINSGK